MGITHKERLKKTLFYKQVDRLPTQINSTETMANKMAGHFGISTQELPVFLDNHLMRVDISFPKRVNQKDRIRYDWWGVGFSTVEEGYFILDNPLSVDKDLDKFTWPDPYSPNLLDDAREVVEIYGDEYFIAPNFGWALFERAWSLRGFEQFLIDMALDTGYVESLFDRIVEIQLALIDRFIALGVDGGYFGDDYGAQKGLLISPQMWRNLIKPRLQRLFTPFLERGLPVILHSDGQIQQIIPDLVEIGLTTLNPVQPEVLDHLWLREHFDGRLSFYGGISTQTALPRGTPDQVIAAISGCIRSLAQEGTGLLLAPSHRLMTDIPMQNIDMLLGYFREMEKQPNNENN